MATKKPTRPPARTPWLEWTAAGVGLVLTLLSIGFIGFEALRGERSPPAIVVEAAGVQRTAHGYVLEVVARNVGGRPAAQVLVEGELVIPGAEPETAEASFDYIPDNSSRHGGLVFPADPRSGALTLRAKGFVEP